jgi:hypothetical protein
MRRVCLTFAIIVIAAACAAAQEPGGAQQQGASVTSGSRTITGCVAIGSPGYVIKTEDGTTFPLRSGTDLGAYVGKKVEINTNWTATGVHVAGPTEGAQTSAAAPGTGPKTAADFAGDLRVRFRGKVLGDCLGKK